MTIGSLFSGVGGLEHGLEAAGFGPVVFQVEIDAFCRKVLAKHWPNADRSVSDVRFAGAATLPKVDLICGGFPCQDVSAAGKRNGLEGARSGLWYEYRRVLDELRPHIAVVENVASGAKRWLPTVRRQLCELGYDTTPLAISAADVGAPHRRARIFVVGVADAYRVRQRQPEGAVPHLGGRAGDGGEGLADPYSLSLWEQPWWRAGPGGREAAQPWLAGEGLAAADGSGQRASIRHLRAWQSDAHGRDKATGLVGDADRRLSGRLPFGASAEHAGAGEPGGVMGDASGERWSEGGAEPAGNEGRRVALDAGVGHAESRVRRDSHGLSAGLDRHQWPAGRGSHQHEWEPPRTVAPKTVKDRVARVKAMGNAVVPACSLVVGRWIRGRLEGKW